MGNGVKSSLEPDQERIGRVQEALRGADLDALITTRTSTVRMLSGYWPVTGASAAIFTRDGTVGVIAPEDEAELVRLGWASEVRTFAPASLDRLQTFEETVREPLRGLAGAVGLSNKSSIGFDSGPQFDPSTYASTFEWSDCLRAQFPNARQQNATPLLEKIKAVLTARELDTVRAACRVARDAFTATQKEVQAGRTESQIAASLRARLAPGSCEGRRFSGFGYCMSGPNASRAYAAYQLTGTRAFEPADLVLMHCNSAYDGLWTDVTRTLSLSPDEHREMFAAIEESRQAAISAVRPGVEARSIDYAARQVLESRGYGKEFRHATGHGVGFAAINHNAHPRIHPQSRERLEVGMVFNIEPAIYIDGVCGLRHCDMVAVTRDGAEVLTDF